jgi:hypothetical protein
MHRHVQRESGPVVQFLAVHSVFHVPAIDVSAGAVRFRPCVQAVCAQCSAVQQMQVSNSRPVWYTLS